jgi:hypothetical protein
MQQKGGIAGRKMKESAGVQEYLFLLETEICGNVSKRGSERRLFPFLGDSCKALI